MSNGGPDPRVTIRFRLRTLLVVMGLVACAFAAPRVYDYVYRAKITPLSDAEARRLRLFGATPIRPMTAGERRGKSRRFTAEYRPRFRSGLELGRQEFRVVASNGYGMTLDKVHVSAEAVEPQVIEAIFAELSNRDTPSATTWIARGVVVDRDGKTQPHAVVGLCDASNQINYVTGRRDGTFQIIVDLRGKTPGQLRRSWLDLRDHTGGWSCETPAFALTGGEVMQVRITLPFTLPAPPTTPTPATGR